METACGTARKLRCDIADALRACCNSWTRCRPPPPQRLLDCLGFANPTRQMNSDPCCRDKRSHAH
eukprot:8984270-Lingulodinium_polyedra.AAC.1